MIEYTHIMKEAGLVAASTAGTTIVDIGTGLVEGQFVVDCSSIEVDTGNELYEISLQGSSQSDFSSDYDDLALCSLGATSAAPGDVLGATGRFIVPFRNEKGGTVYPYLRAYCSVAGTVATGINFNCFLAKHF